MELLRGRIVAVEPSVRPRFLEGTPSPPHPRPHPPPAPLQPGPFAATNISTGTGQRPEQYAILNQLAHGAYGQVFRASRLSDGTLGLVL